ncbi:MAG TPA: DNA translocase FtsK, partial [Natronincola sp.]|nr:DNA translocase FtsK [Natronincola sp.]
PIRAQGAWISDKEVESIVKFWKKQGEPIYEEAIENETISIAHEQEEDDELLPDAIRLVIENGQASISMLQRRFRIGYSRAARLIDVMEVRGIVGTHQGSKPREVLADITILEEV